MIVRPMVYLGIDPGWGGGLTSLHFRERKVTVISVKMPDTEQDIWYWLQTQHDNEDVLNTNHFAVIEKVWGHIGGGAEKGGGASNGSAMFRFGHSYGLLRGFLIAASIPFEEVTPQTWQKALGLGTRAKTDSKTQWKNKLKQKAQNLFPKVKVTLANSDSLLIAEYCRRKQEGKL